MVTKSISSSTRPMSAGSRSFQSRTRPRMRCHARAVSACCACGQPRARHTPFFQSVPFGTVGHAVIPEPLRFDRLPDVDEGMADDERVPATGSAAHRVRDPRLLGPGDQMVDQHAEPSSRPRDRTPRRSRPDHRLRRGIRRPRPRFADRHPTPVRRARRRACPRRRYGWTTRLFAFASGTATDPDAVRPPDVATARRGAVRITGLPSTRYPGPTGNGLRRPRLSSSSIRPYSIRTTAPT